MSENRQHELTARALDPAASAVIEACAGSGKTWMLVSRIVRLLLADASPSQILAITFTRKAAQEMATRLRDWLFELATAPDDAVSFVLIARDADAAIGNGTDDILHWMLWNIPKGTRALPEAVPQANQLPDGTRQISASGPYYRGPGAPASGPAHHYVFEIYALDSTIDVPAVGQSPPLTRAAVMAAMAGKIRGKGSMVGLFKR